ncbi:putative signaling protein [Methylophilaceae bacterium]|nr:putative signaling protein [Methylophilaceae bacterium]
MQISKLIFKGNRLTPLSVALLYFAFAVIWILASGYLVTFSVQDPDIQGRLELAKGMLFVFVTAGLLYLLLSIWRVQENIGPAPADHAGTARTTGIILLFVGLVLIVPLLGLAITRLYGPQIESEAYENLEAIARLKSEQIENWLNQRRADTNVLAANSTQFVRAIGNIAKGENAYEDRVYARDKLESLRVNYDYSTFLLLDTQARLLLADGVQTGIAPELEFVVARALASGKVEQTDLYRGPDGDIHMDWVVPIYSVGTEVEAVIAFVVLRTAPEQFLYPLVQTWPTASETAETMLVRREGESVLYLNELNRRKGTALSLKLPLSDADLPAAVALRKNLSGTVQGVDYQGDEVLAAYRPIAGTDWHIVAKINRDEILAPLRDMTLLVSSVAFIFVSVISLALLMLWKQQLRLQNLQTLAHKNESDRLLHHFFNMPFVGMAVISPHNKKFIRFNDHLCQITGYSREELMGKSCLDFTHQDDIEADLREFNRIIDGESSGYTMEKRYFRKDGALIHAAVDTQCVRKADGTVDYLLCTAKDITRQKADEARIHRLTQLYAALSQCNQAIVRYTTEQALFEKICETAVHHGGMKMAWIGMVDFEQNLIKPVTSYGDEIGYLDDIRISIDPDTPFGGGPVGTAVRENTPYWCQDFTNQPETRPWLERSRGAWASIAALPICRGGVAVGALCMYSAETNAFDQDAKNLLTEMAIDISYALDNFDREIRRTNAEAMVIESETKFHLLFDRSLDGLLILDGDELVECNPAVLDMMNCRLEHILHTPPWALSPPEQPDGQASEEKFREMIAIANDKGRHRFEWVYRRLNGEDFPAEVSMVAIMLNGRQVFYTTWRDISEHKKAEARIRHLAHFDVLTGLPNRTLLTDRINQAISLAQRSQQPLTIMFFDLDRFKNVNDTLGHDMGDELLIQVSRRLQSAVREEDTISRLGGDEFVLLLQATNADGASRVAEKVIGLISQPYHIKHHELTITPSIGIAVYPDDGEDFEKLLKSADIAMYRAKQAGRNNYQFFTAKMQEDSVRAMQLESALQHAIEFDQFLLYYQPQLSLETGEVVGVEALLRWQHPEFGWISPAEFIPVAEETGDILKIGEWVIKQATQQLKAWIDQGLPPIKMAVNLSAVQFRHPHLPETVSKLLEDVALSPEYLELELTESVSMDDPVAAIAVMDNLFDRGIRMSIDDFGTGYSSLSHLKRFKVYKLKIDQSFVRDIMTDPEDKAIVNSIVSLAKSLGMKTIAEGVETAGQVDFLRECMCDEVQGYYFSKPLPAGEFEVYFKSRI